MCYNAQMATKKKDEKEITVVAELEVSSEGDSYTIRTFDAAWHRVLVLPTPATMSFNRWVRKN
jgi:hypothetical protein